MNRSNLSVCILLSWFITSCVSNPPIRPSFKDDLDLIASLKFGSNQTDIAESLGRPDKVISEKAGETFLIYFQQTVEGLKIERFSFGFSSDGYLISKTFIPPSSLNLTFKNFSARYAGFDLQPLPRVICGDHAYYDKNENLFRDRERGVWVKLDRDRKVIDSIGWLSVAEAASRTPAEDSKCPPLRPSHLRTTEAL